MLSQSDIDALLRAAHPDPFAVLGPHLTGETLWVRALLPGAEAVELLAPEDPETPEAPEVLARFDAIEPGVLFQAELAAPAKLPLAYRLRVHYPLGHSEIVEDPYRFGPSVGELDRHLLAEGSHLRPWHVLGARLHTQGGVEGVRFCVWAPNAARASVLGDFNHWDGRRHPMRLHPGAGLWELFIPGLGPGALYKYELRTREGQLLPAKADPYGFAAQLRPETASVVAPARAAEVHPLPETRRDKNHRHAPVSIYEIHLGSWRRGPEGEFLDWAALIDQLPAYVAELGFTHVELLPIAEHPFDGSWGYQVTGLYAPTSRFGDPHAEGAGLAELIAALHERDIGVILDWVPAHFPSDAHALARFDGTALYEYADPREGFHADWDTLIYNFGRNEVRNFLVGNALYWLECWGLDGLRVDAVASMLYRDYSREEGQWVPNVHGGRENLEAIALLRRVNEVVGAEAPGTVTLAEESTAWPGVSRPTSAGGLGFHYKWNMGWMHDTLSYMAKEPVHRKHHHNQMSFAMMYAYDEHFVLPLSHDEVVHGKGSLLGKMPGDRWQKFANLRAYYAFMWTHPGKKLLFMGGEFGQEREWNHDQGLDWHLLGQPAQGPAPSAVAGDNARAHRGLQALVRDLNGLYAGRPELHELDCEPGGFEWIAADDADHSVYAYLRRDRSGRELLVVCNFTPVPREGYRVGLPAPGRWRERLNTDAAVYAGSDVGNGGEALRSEAIGAHGREHSLALTLPPLAALILEPLTTLAPQHS